MKNTITRATINQLYDKVYRAGYCDLQNIFWNKSRRAHNSGAYGWNFDLYAEYCNGISLAFTTGYRNMTGERIPSDLLQKYDAIARAIIDDYKKPYEQKCEELDKNRADFITELLQA